MEKLILVVHLLTAMSIIGLIMIQQGKGAEAGASFGGGASQTIFGSAGGWSFFSKITALFSIVFFATSVALAVIAKDRASIDEAILPESGVLQSVDLGEDIPGVTEAQSGDVPVIDDDTSTSEIPEPFEDIPQ